MGLLDALTGKRKILSYEILFSAGPAVGVNTFPEAILPFEYVRFWACYQAKIIYNLGGPGAVGGLMALGFITRIVELDIDSSTNCFERANVSDAVQYVSPPPGGTARFTGDYYEKGDGRIIQTHFPPDISEQQVVFSGLAILQNSIERIGSPECFDLLKRTITQMVALYDSGQGEGVEATVLLPESAYHVATLEGFEAFKRSEHS